MQRRLPIMVLLVALAAAAGWLAWRSGGQHGETPVLVPVAPSSASSAGADPGERHAPSPPRDVAQTPSAPELATVEDAPSDEARVAASPDGVAFVGRVTWPAGVPSDEDARLIAVGRGGDEVARFELAGAREFRVVLPKDHKRGRLKLDARYLLLSEEVKLEIKRASEPLTIEPELGARLHGRVIAPRPVPDGASLAGCEVELNNYGTDGAEHRRVQRSTRVDAEGRFEIGGLPGGQEYTLRIDPQWCAPLEVGEIAAEAGQAIERTLELRVGARLRGRVVDESGAAVAGARVAAVEPAEGFRAFGLEQLPALREVESSGDGSFELLGVRPGEVHVIAKLDGYLLATTDALELADAAQVDGITLALLRGGVIAGVVQWPDGSPAEGAKVSVESAAPIEIRIVGADEVVGRAIADANGRFTVSGLAGASFDVHAQAPRADPGASKREQRQAPLWRRSIEDVSAGGAPLVVVLEPPAILVGLVVDDLGAPIDDFTVHATPIVELSERDELRVAQRFADAAGRFQLERTHPGEWRVRATSRDHVASPAVDVELPSSEPVTLACVRPSMLAGRVVDGAGEPVVKAQVSVVQADPRSAAEWDEGEMGTTTSGADGSFELRRVAPGSWRLRATHGEFATSFSQPLAIAPSSRAEGLVIVMTLGGRLEGEVRFTQLDDVGIWARCEALDHMEYAKARSDGSFTIERLPAGDYTVRASQRDSSAMGSQAKAKVEIVDGATARVVLGSALERPIELHGRVTSNGDPAALVPISVGKLGPKGPGRYASTSTDSSGRYSLTLDGSGPYVLEVRSASGASVSYELEVPDRDRHAFDVALATRTIAGRVVGRDRRPLGDVEVSAQQEGDRAPGEAHGRGHAASASDGRFRIEGLPPGVYSLTARGEARLVDGELDRGEHGRVRVRGLDVRSSRAIDDLEIVLGPGAVLEGDVRGASEGFAQVLAFDASGERVSASSIDVGESGATYRLTGLPAGTLSVRVQAESYIHARPIVVDLREGEARELAIDVVPTPRLAVRVLGADGAPLDARVRLEREGQAPVESSDARSSHDFALVPGTYAAIATVGDRSARTSVELEAGAKREVVLRVE